MATASSLFAIAVEAMLVVAAWVLLIRVPPVIMVLALGDMAQIAIDSEAKACGSERQHIIGSRFQDATETRARRFQF